MTLLRKRIGRGDERGAALLEFAIALLILVPLVAVIFDAGLGFSASRSSASTARTAARVGALAGESPTADFRVIDAVRAQYPQGPGDDTVVEFVIIYRSAVDNSSGAPPAGCLAGDEHDPEAGVSGEGCNVYLGSEINGYSALDFATETVTVDGEEVEICTSGTPHESWCPVQRRADEGSFLGVYIQTTKQATVGIGAKSFTLKDRAVFAMYFAPEPVDETEVVAP